MEHEDDDPPESQHRSETKPCHMIADNVSSSKRRHIEASGAAEEAAKHTVQVHSPAEATTNPTEREEARRLQQQDCLQI